ncbi:MAG: ester cyclase [Thermoleophilia bacterium]|nr:ester cyclase [Thermoleophilia bacterium]
MSTFRIVDGKIIEAWDYPDMMGLMQQIGAAPAIGEAVAA